MTDRAQNPEAAFAERVLGMLDEDLAELDGRIAERLAAARQSALRRAPERARARMRPFWVPAGAFAVAVLAAVVLLRVPPAADPGREALFDLEVLSANEQLEMLENLDFYQWLASDDQAG